MGAVDLGEAGALEGREVVAIIKTQTLNTLTKASILRSQEIHFLFYIFVHDTPLMLISRPTARSHIFLLRYIDNLLFTFDLGYFEI